MLLAQVRILSLDEAIAGMMQEESHMKLHSETKGDVRMHSTLVVINSGMIGIQRETYKCYNYEKKCKT
jgi:ABC-type branched-subunit amino acid transport system ATPase component